MSCGVHLDKGPLALDGVRQMSCRASHLALHVFQHLLGGVDTVADAFEHTKNLGLESFVVDLARAQQPTSC